MSSAGSKKKYIVVATPFVGVFFILLPTNMYNVGSHV